MGDVYRARDVRLDRLVAIKVLAPRLAGDRAFRDRFEREARVIGALNHPHICTLYDLGHERVRPAQSRQVGPETMPPDAPIDDAVVDFIVMECLDGETLTERLARRGALPPAQAVAYAIQIADALDTAHRAGIVHRDLKPGNIMLTKAGAKLVDFGLARSISPVADSMASTQANVTIEGTIVGTLPYMAPEQVEGKEVDARSDIFAFGAVLHEMLTGRRAFDGRTQAGLIAAILTDVPPLVGAVNPSVSRALSSIVKTCLEKDPDVRWQSVRDLRRALELSSDSQTTGADPVSDRPPGARSRRSSMMTAIASVAVGLGVLTLSWALRSTSRESPLGEVRFSIAPPEGAILDAKARTRPQFALSPDGRFLAFVDADNAGLVHLWVRPMDALSARKLQRTEGASFPFWSPDGQSVAFFADGRLKRIQIAGGFPVVVCDATNGNGGTWNRNGVIVFASGRRLQQVRADGGVPANVETLDASEAEVAHSWPQFLPDGRRFLYLVKSRAHPDANGVYVQALGSTSRTLLLSTVLRALMVPQGYLLFIRDGTLMAQHLDETNLHLDGDAFAVAEDVSYSVEFGAGAFAASDNGVVAYRASGAGEVAQVAWYERDGTRTNAVLEPGNYGQIELSPDDRYLVLQRGIEQRAETDLWLLDLSNRVLSRLTSGAYGKTDPIWSPDSRTVAFSEAAGTGREIRQVTVGSDKEARLLADGRIVWLDDWSPDGRQLIFHTQDGSVGLLPISGDRTPQSLLVPGVAVDGLRLSPDGQWIAFSSSESGRHEISVARFPSIDGRRQVSSGGGGQPRWRSDGKELFYVSLESKMMAVDIRGVETAGGSRLETGTAHALFAIGAMPFATNYHYAVTADGRRFLIREVVTTAAIDQINVAVNWLSRFEK